MSFLYTMIFELDLQSIRIRLVLLSPRSVNFELESEVNKELRLITNIAAQFSGDYLMFDWVELICFKKSF